VLCLAGIGLAAYKIAILDFPLLPDTTVDVWDIEARVSFEATGGPARIDLFVPRDTAGHIVLDEHFASRGYGLTTTNPTPNRQVTWSRQQASGQQTLYYRATTRAVRAPEKPPRSEVPAAVKPWFEGPQLAAADALLAAARAESADVSTLASAILRRLSATPADGDAGLLLGNRKDPAQRLQLAADLLQHGGVPARVAHGVRLQGLERAAPIVHWLQVHDGQDWRSFDPVSMEPGLGPEYLAWWRGPASMVRGKGVRHVHVTVTIARDKETALAGATSRGHALAPGLMSVSLLDLPLDTQAVYHVLLLVPIGALILVLLRNVVGLKTFGTFMPVLIALAFRETRLVWGLVLFTLLVGLGLVVRFYLERLKLLLVPRLAAVLTVVVMLMALVSIAAHHLGIERGLAVALFPMVILTMTIERMSIVWEERGATEAMQQGLGSLLAATLAYLAMDVPQIAHLVFVYPELLLVVLAALLLLGRYTGYRLTELRRFRGIGGRPS